MYVVTRRTPLATHRIRQTRTWGSRRSRASPAATRPTATCSSTTWIIRTTTACASSPWGRWPVCARRFRAREHRWSFPLEAMPLPMPDASRCLASMRVRRQRSSEAKGRRDSLTALGGSQDQRSGRMCSPCSAIEKAKECSDDSNGFASARIAQFARCADHYPRFTTRWTHAEPTSNDLISRRYG